MPRPREALRELRRVVGQEPHPRAAEHLQHANRDRVVALVVVEAQHRVGIDSVEAGILQLIGTELVDETETTAFLLQVENDAAARLLELGQRQAQLVAAVAASRAEHVPGQARRMQPHRHRPRQVRIAHDDRHRSAVASVAEDHEPRRTARRRAGWSPPRQSRASAIAACAKPRDRARQQRVTSGGSHAATAGDLPSAISRAGSSWASLASSIAAAAPGPAGTTSRCRVTWVSAANEKMSAAVSRSPIAIPTGPAASIPSARARRAVTRR